MKDISGITPFDKHCLKSVSTLNAASIQPHLFPCIHTYKHIHSSQETPTNFNSPFLLAILENTTEGFLCINAQGLIVLCNSSAESILEIPARKLLHHKYDLHLQDKVFGFSIQTALDSQLAVPATCMEYISPHNLHRELEVSATYIPHKDSSTLLLIILKEISERRHLQQMVDHTHRMKVLGEMAAQVAHAIRNPLGGIKGFASLLYRDLSSYPNMQQMAVQIIEATDGLNMLVNEILHYARPINPCFENTNLLELLQELKKHTLADSLNAEKKIAIDIFCPAGEIVLPLDRLLIKTALLNLFVNSLEAMPNGGHISLTVHKKQAFIVLIFQDTGEGISEENIAKLYSPHFTTKPHGNGLGLAEVQKVIQAHGGSIAVASTIGQGTTFTIKFPIKQGSL